MNESAPTQNHPQEDRCVCGVEGIDAILGGGFPKNCFYLIQGDPGSGKTTMALQFLMEGKRRGERVFYITLSESKSELVKVAASHGWSLDEIPLLELSAIEALLRPEAQTTVFHASEVELGRISALLRDELRRVKPDRIVFDSLSEFRLMAETPLRYRRQLLSLKQEFAHLPSTVLLLDDKMGNEQIGVDPHILSLAHGVIEMEQLSPDYGSSRRRLRVMKMRGVKFLEGFHDYVIATGGLRVFPRLVAGHHRNEVPSKAISSGLKSLDDLFGGGIDLGTTTLVIGPAGTGKSTLAMQYASRLATQGERSMVFTFDETKALLIARGQALGLNLNEYVNEGLLRVDQVDPAELSPGEFMSRIVQGVESGCKLLVIDSLNGYLNAMPGERYLMVQLHELCSYLNQQGVITILVMAQHGLVSAAHSPVDLSYLADTVVSLRYFEVAGEVREAIAVVKKRSGSHEKTIREFKLESGTGIHIGPPLREFEGVLAGTPIFRGKADRMIQSPHAAQ
ncbi:MAG TPA: ATPase domain-containing protein [Verrucomicrobiae bacterium]|nr:ATPase domain-containing protein [Verrucomicrobiae bacterium]